MKMQDGNAIPKLLLVILIVGGGGALLTALSNPSVGPQGRLGRTSSLSPTVASRSELQVRAPMAF